MPWPAPLEVPGVAYHVVHSGNGQPITFSCDADYRVYRTLIATYCSGYALDVWAYCLLPDRVHLVAVPGRIESVRKAVAEAHRYYNRHINLVKNWRGNCGRGASLCTLSPKITSFQRRDTWRCCPYTPGSRKVPSTIPGAAPGHTARERMTNWSG